MEDLYILRNLQNKQDELEEEDVIDIAKIVIYALNTNRYQIRSGALHRQR